MTNRYLDINSEERAVISRFTNCALSVFVSVQTPFLADTTRNLHKYLYRHKFRRVDAVAKGFNERRHHLDCVVHTLKDVHGPISINFLVDIFMHAQCMHIMANAHTSQ